MLGEGLATRTTREALEAVRSMQNQHEPLANSANAVLEKLLAYDRAVDEDLQAHNPYEFRAMTEAGDALEAAVAAYFGASPPPPLTASGTRLRCSSPATSPTHAGSPARRATRVLGREAPGGPQPGLPAHNLAGGSGLAINGTEVVARRSLAELEEASTPYAATSPLPP